MYIKVIHNPLVVERSPSIKDSYCDLMYIICHSYTNLLLDWASFLSIASNFFFFFFGPGVPGLDASSQFPDLGLNLSGRGESAKSPPGSSP